MVRRAISADERRAQRAPRSMAASWPSQLAGPLNQSALSAGWVSQPAGPQLAGPQPAGPLNWLGLNRLGLSTGWPSTGWASQAAGPLTRKIASRARFRAV